MELEVKTSGLNTATNYLVKLQPQRDNILLEPSDEFVITSEIQKIIDHALVYLDTGYAVHFAGSAGTGKTTLAFHVAALRGRGITLIQGDEEFGSSDLVGQDTGYHKSKLVDNFIHSVLRTEEEMRSVWADNRLTTACRNGDTLIYDEFSRSRPEANNVLLSVLSEKMLSLPKLRLAGEGYLQVHPEFRAVFTSNPAEYAGVHKAQDALMDRLITISLNHYDRETEVQITMSRSGLARGCVERIVDLIRELRARSASKGWPSLRACIAIARIVEHVNGQAQPEDPFFLRVCRDVLHVHQAKETGVGTDLSSEELENVFRQVCCAQ